MDNNNQTVINDNPVKKDRKGFSIAALVLGILAIILCCTCIVSIIFGIIAIIVGILGLKSSKRGMAIAGISTGAVGLILGIIIGVVLWLPMGIYIYNKANITSDALENIQSIQDELDSYDTNYDSFYDYDDDYDF